MREPYTVTGTWAIVDEDDLPKRVVVAVWDAASKTTTWQTYDEGTDQWDELEMDPILGAMLQGHKQ